MNSSAPFPSIYVAVRQTSISSFPFKLGRGELLSGLRQRNVYVAYRGILAGNPRFYVSIRLKSHGQTVADLATESEIPQTKLFSFSGLVAGVLHFPAIVAPQNPAMPNSKIFSMPTIRNVADTADLLVASSVLVSPRQIVCDADEFVVALEGFGGGTSSTWDLLVGIETL